jgi:uncharacterized Zn finger protein (UPF0148 family)
MTQRKCPNCGLPWYSASGRTWICPECGALIAREDEVPLMEESEKQKIAK